MRIVVVGAGLAGAQAVTELRSQGYDEELVLLGSEEFAPYERPPLSKGLLLDSADEESVFVHPWAWYADHQVDLRTGQVATGIDLGHRTVSVGDERLGYDRLLLATGARPRRLAQVDDADVPSAYLRTLDDARVLKRALAGRLLVVGAGWIGLEVAAAARTRGAEVTVVETAAQPLLGALGPELGEVFADLHREHGVDLRLGTSMDLVQRAPDGRAAVRFSDGHEDHYDLVVVGIGAVPEDRLAREAGLDVDDGVLVDATLRTSDPYVWAAGDLASHDHPVLGRRVRVEHWDNAIHQGRHAARAMLGDESPYEKLPFFFTDQYDLGMEYVGSVGPQGYDEVVVRGDRDTRVMTALWIRDDRVAAGMHLNDWDALADIKELVGQPFPGELRDPRDH